MAAGRVPVSEAFPEGVRFSFSHVRVVEGSTQAACVVDNAHGKGPHEHFQGEERPLPARSWKEHRARFGARVAELRGASP